MRTETTPASKQKPIHLPRWGLVLILIWLLPALACNIPLGPAPTGNISAEDLRATLAALNTPTKPPQGPMPGETTPSTQTPSPFWGLETPTAGAPLVLTVPPPSTNGPGEPFVYHALPGDMLPALASRFGVEPGQITSLEPIAPEGYLHPGQPLEIPNTFSTAPPYPGALLPDSEIIFSPSTVGFDIQAFAAQAGGYFSTHVETVENEALSGVQIVQRVSAETSTNPRLLLALIEHISGWVYGPLRDARDLNHPLNLHVPGYKGLYKELSVAAKLLNVGYYGWRQGTLTEIQFRDQRTARLSPTLNAGSISLQYLFSELLDEAPWVSALYGENSFLALHQKMFGNPWERAAVVEPFLSPALAQPPLELPFAPGERWSLTGGPHLAWNTGTPDGALDFAPVTGEKACIVSRAWVTASAPGVVVRTGEGVVVLDLDGDGYEQTGWILFYLHIAAKDRVIPGAVLDTDDPLGHPSCEGGRTTGTHVHIARKYNGEWMAADGPIPFLLSGWEAHSGQKRYEGTLLKGDQVVYANPGGPRTSIIVR